MKADAIKATLERVAELSQERDDTKQRLIKQIEESENRSAALKVSISDTIDSMNIDEHHKLSEEYRRSCDELELLRKKLDRINTLPFISEEEYSQLVEQINEYERNCIKKLQQKVAIRFKEIKEMYDKETARIEEVNHALSMIQRLQQERSVFPAMYNDPTGLVQNLGWITTRPAFEKISGIPGKSAPLDKKA